MNPIDKRLLDVLKKELEIYNEALMLSKSRVEAIQNNNGVLIDSITKHEEAIVEKIKKHEAKRLEIMNELHEATLIEYVGKNIDDNFRNEALKLREEILKIIEEIKQNNEFAQKLIDISSGILNRFMDEVTGKKEMGYKKDKQKTKVSHGNILNKKI